MTKPARLQETDSATKTIDNGWDSDKFPAPLPGPSDLRRFGGADVVRSYLAVIETAFAERAALEAKGAGEQACMKPMWRLAQSLCDRRLCMPEHIGKVAERLGRLDAGIPSEQVLRSVRAARRADDWDYCADHHHVDLRGTAANVEAACYPMDNADSSRKGGGLRRESDVATPMCALVSRETGLAWRDDLLDATGDLLVVVAHTRPANISRRYRVSRPLDYLRGDTVHGRFGQPVRDELVAAYGVPLPVALELCHIVLGTRTYDQPAGYGSSSALLVTLLHRAVDDRVAQMWAGALARATAGQALSGADRMRVRRAVTAHRRALVAPDERTPRDFGIRSDLHGGYSPSALGCADPSP